jgi:hypothetical protein
VTRALGDTDDDGDFDELYAFGARSFSIWTTKSRLVFDSGAEFAEITAALFESCDAFTTANAKTEFDDRSAEESFPCPFNTADDKTEFDDRSDDSGTEPEGITVAKIEGRWYAFIILERIGGIMAYDITHPDNAQFVQYFNSRNFAENAEVDDFFPDDYAFPAGLDESDFSKCNPGNQGPGDSAPEVILFIPKGKSPINVPLLVVAHETTSSTAIYAINTSESDDDEDDKDDRDDRNESKKDR